MLAALLNKTECKSFTTYTCACIICSPLHSDSLYLPKPGSGLRPGPNRGGSTLCCALKYQVRLSRCNWDVGLWIHLEPDFMVGSTDLHAMGLSCIYWPQDKEVLSSLARTTCAVSADPSSLPYWFLLSHVLQTVSLVGKGHLPGPGDFPLLYHVLRSGGLFWLSWNVFWPRGLWSVLFFVSSFCLSLHQIHSYCLLWCQFAVFL